MNIIKIFVAGRGNHIFRHSFRTWKICPIFSSFIPFPSLLSVETDDRPVHRFSAVTQRLLTNLDHFFGGEGGRGRGGFHCSKDFVWLFI